MKRVCLVISLPLLFLAPSLAGASDPRDSVCLDCHEAGEDAELDELEAEVHMPTFLRGVHGTTDCIQCHVGVSEDHDDEGQIPDKVDCGNCHAQEVDDFSTGIHGTLVAEGDPDAPRCEFCHGQAHYTLSQHDPDSRTFPMNVPELCGECHRQGERSAVRNHASETHILENYRMSIHGKGLLESGLIVSATCSKCHTAHRELPVDDPRSSVNPSNIKDTCGNCHYGIKETLAQSVHSPTVTHTDAKLPGCNDCHTSHQIQRVTNGDFRIEISSQCGKCHEKLVESYFETYHGKVSKLRGELTAKCYDCHGSHDIRSPSDPASTLSSANIIGTCGKCHSGANAGFVEYLPHATHDDREKYPQLFWAYWGMTSLLLGTMGFFGVHTILWFTRSLIESLRGSRREESGAPPIEPSDEDVYFRRFELSHILLHLTVVVTFLTLVFTGMCLKFPDNPYFSVLAGAFGGPVVLGVLHRLSAIFTFGYFAYHLAAVFVKWRHRQVTLRGLVTEDYSMIPLPRDLVALKKNVAWFLGLGPRPQLGRWTYWEKFDYFAVFWGVAIIGLTGLMLWFSETVTLLIPGWWINVATVIHSDEALLAAAFIFTVHFFNGHFRPGKFPMDLVIFTGRSTLAELKKDHPKQYEELVASGELEKRLVGPPPRWLSITAAVFGTIFLLTGLALIGAIALSLIHS